MAIRFMDKEPEAGEPKPKPAQPEAARPEVAATRPSSEPAATADGRDTSSDHPSPKPRGRQARPASTEPEPHEPAADGLLPGLQAHAKPTPKPRGRKKAFG